MKNSFQLLIIILIVSNISYCQIKIGENPTKIDSTSLLELESNSKGLLLPRITTQEMNKIYAPDGMIITLINPRLWFEPTIFGSH